MSGPKPSETSHRATIIAALEKWGPMSSVEMRARGVNIPALASYLGNLCSRGVLKRLGGLRGAIIYGLDGQAGREPLFALNEKAQLTIKKGDKELELVAGEIKLLKQFLDASENVWCPE